MSERVKQALSRARETGDYNHLGQIFPYMNFLGIKAVEGALCHLLPAPHLIGNPALPALHGGVVGALMESAATLALVMESDSDQIPKIIDISIDYLRSARPVETFAQGFITKQGRRVANVRVESWQDDRAKPIAAAHIHFLLA